MSASATAQSGNVVQHSAGPFEKDVGSGPSGNVQGKGTPAGGYIPEEGIGASGDAPHAMERHEERVRVHERARSACDRAHLEVLSHGEVREGVVHLGNVRETVQHEIFGVL